MAYRLPNGFGSVYKLSGNRRKPWAARKTVGWKDSGQPIYAFVGYYSSRTEALTALSDFNKDPYDLQIGTITFEQLYTRWSDEHFKKISHSGVISYSSVHRYCDAISSMRVVDIKLDHLQKPCDSLICSAQNRPMSYDAFRDTYWDGVMVLLGMDHKPHDTRHTCVSLLTEAGVDQRIIRKIVGHKGQGVTEVVYTHVELPAKLEAINKI